MVVHEHVGEPRVFYRHRRLFDDHAVYARIGLVENDRELIVLKTDDDFQIGPGTSKRSVSGAIMFTLLDRMRT